MATERVYQWEMYDRVSRCFVRQQTYATEAAIVAAQGIAIYSTGQDVPAIEVGPTGVWAADSGRQSAE